MTWKSMGFLMRKQLGLPWHRETQLPKWINSILSPREPQEGQGQEPHAKQRGGRHANNSASEGGRENAGPGEHLHPKSRTTLQNI